MTAHQTVYIIDDDEAIRKSTCFLLKSAGLKCKAYESAAAFLEDYKDSRPGCMILDLHMAGLNGMELLHRMRSENIMLPVVVVTGTGTIPVAVQGMKLGIFDFLEKPVNPNALLGKVRDALTLDANRRTQDADIEHIRTRLSTLSVRERELLGHIVEGMPNKLIAVAMGISIKTVENHRARLMDKTQATNAADLVRMQMLIKMMP